MMPIGCQWCQLQNEALSIWLSQSPGTTPSLSLFSTVQQSFATCNFYQDLLLSPTTNRAPGVSKFIPLPATEHNLRCLKGADIALGIFLQFIPLKQNLKVRCLKGADVALQRKTLLCWNAIVSHWLIFWPEQSAPEERDLEKVALRYVSSFNKSNLTGGQID